ncbi:hypothetical protein PTSG_07631 [Salpingoeca rosetta]|uniref:Uncharacterized protein n=1 Tax=Salpingoeca rosetta (strain ATCC 50818 / BSB-021) TaxID=946362 RepID=F2UHB5_SALR5|nr:uncharacterized protein PTSG_07631 [Salpingoeca rosetta]EGD76514.1 hypothetical protein PTSG_07631 [Salpingoeca rosetta]|eukprot:XP_004991428.1 hypothetical protein PTSG_07631 [Salpingoeca rosetta]
MAEPPRPPAAPTTTTTAPSSAMPHGAPPPRPPGSMPAQSPGMPPPTRPMPPVSTPRTAAATPHTMPRMPGMPPTLASPAPGGMPRFPHTPTPGRGMYPRTGHPPPPSPHVASSPRTPGMTSARRYTYKDFEAQLLQALKKPKSGPMTRFGKSIFHLAAQDLKSVDDIAKYLQAQQAAKVSTPAPQGTTAPPKLPTKPTKQSTPSSSASTTAAAGAGGKAGGKRRASATAGDGDEKRAKKTPGKRPIGRPRKPGAKTPAKPRAKPKKPGAKKKEEDKDEEKDLLDVAGVNEDEEEQNLLSHQQLIGQHMRRDRVDRLLFGDADLQPYIDRLVPAVLGDAAQVEASVITALALALQEYLLDLLSKARRRARRSVKVPAAWRPLQHALMEGAMLDTDVLAAGELMHLQQQCRDGQQAQSLPAGNGTTANAPSGNMNYDSSSSSSGSGGGTAMQNGARANGTTHGHTTTTPAATADTTATSTGRGSGGEDVVVNSHGRALVRTGVIREGHVRALCMRHISHSRARFMFRHLMGLSSNRGAHQPR